jgi:hypothetical protein
MFFPVWRCYCVESGLNQSLYNLLLTIFIQAMGGNFLYMCYATLTLNQTAALSLASSMSNLAWYWRRQNNLVRLYFPCRFIRRMYFRNSHLFFRKNIIKLFCCLKGTLILDISNTEIFISYADS